MKKLSVKLGTKLEIKKLELEQFMGNFLKEEKGEFGVKQIAVTVAVIVVIGVIVTVFKDQSDSWIGQVWDFLFEQIEKLTQ